MTVTHLLPARLLLLARHLAVLPQVVQHLHRALVLVVGTLANLDKHLVLLVCLAREMRRLLHQLGHLVIQF